MAIKIYTEPTEEPIAVDELTKRHLRLDDTVDDDLVAMYITAARKYCESFSGRVFITQTWDLYLDSFPDTDYIELPFPPLQSVTSVQYKPSTSSTLTTWASTNYIVDIVSQPGLIRLAYGISWPSTYDEPQAVQIRFICGYGLSSSVPAQFKQAIMLKLTDLFEHRGDEGFNENIERAVEALLWSDRIVPV